MSRLSISSWSLHRALGPRYRPAQGNPGLMVPDGPPGELNLLDLPARIAARGIRTLEVCHFHLPGLDEGYLADLRAALEGAGVELFGVLIDAGDITHPDPAARAQELEWVRSWVETAARCGATRARVIAGDAEVPAGNGEAVLGLSAEGLRGLARFGREWGVRVITENFRPLARRPEHLLKVLEMCEGEVGLCADFGNFKGETKYDDLAAILPRADSVHAKAHYPAAGEMDREDFVRCMDLARVAGFDGPYSLIFDGPGDEWGSLAEIQEVVASYVNE
ncbi:MAG: hypothetical protein A3F84_04725 [Candidatus Handelsmanbacteria bacterium RIFCSPLOWO2_12_FULL_64_10]|uniref:Xylose isomerase-like TIM barrel domain-containing protein n=1 Tax=Handelsmanbacteria sp. (strain RIFCSPLOWO2_12_FULL_64_10) TaxID=1817868 RepID=A0A1F6CQ93_HANXR|nr:MAG: hypothetical protein A3F84_04725 [Candidatus Handelsmanbacteria bacterium RIFCSPLOWO2_12_FULL_64_10]